MSFCACSSVFSEKERERKNKREIQKKYRAQLSTASPSFVSLFLSVFGRLRMGLITSFFCNHVIILKTYCRRHCRTSRARARASEREIQKKYQKREKSSLSREEKKRRREKERGARSEQAPVLWFSSLVRTRAVRPYFATFIVVIASLQISLFFSLRKKEEEERRRKKSEAHARERERKKMISCVLEEKNSKNTIQR